MADSGKRWTIQDRYHNPIYLTQERWEHIVDETNHPEMVDYEEYLKTAISYGQRRQEPLNPRKYRYYSFLDNDFESGIILRLVQSLRLNQSWALFQNIF